MRTIILLFILFIGTMGYSQSDSLIRLDTFTNPYTVTINNAIVDTIKYSVADTDSICSTMYCISGIGSYYGRQFQGRYTSSGERFDMYKLTAAHKNLPLGTYVVVTNLSNGKSVVVKINDRMPKSNHREIDLSYAAAKELNYITAGLAKVQIEIYKPK